MGNIDAADSQNHLVRQNLPPRRRTKPVSATRSQQTKGYHHPERPEYDRKPELFINATSFQTQKLAVSNACEARKRPGWDTEFQKWWSVFLI